MPFVSEEEVFNLKNSLPKQLGEAIQLARKKCNMTQIHLAELTQKDRQYIYKIEKGVVSPNIGTIGIIAKALGITISELVENL